jgi:thioredoxin reductase (NADPH)
VSGAEFANRLVQQARRFEVETVSAQAVGAMRKDGEYVVVVTEDGTEYTGHAVLVATGSRYSRLGVPGENELIGSGVHYCATCDGPFYKGKRVAVVGGGNSAVEEGIFLTRFASHVTLLVRGEKLTASQVALEKLAEQEKMDVLLNTEVVEMSGSPKLQQVKVRDRSTGEARVLEPGPAGLFVFIGLKPNSEFLPPEIERDQRGFVLTSAALETSMPGVFAAGDVRANSTKQAASAVGEGATAALAIRDYLRRIG